MAVCLGTNWIFAKVYEAPINNDSVYITALILALIINPAASFAGFGFLFWAAVLAIATKYLIAYRKKHFFNPAAAAVFITAIVINQSATWWIGNGVMLIFVAIGGLLVVRKIRRFDLVLSFLIVFYTTTIILNLQNNIGIWETIYKATLHAPVFFFAFVMLTEPSTTPTTRIKRILYGAFTGFLFAPQISIFSYYFTPESALLVGNIFSYLLSPTKKISLYLKEKIKVAENTYDFVFGLDRPMAFFAGQYMEWTVGHDNPDTRGVRRYFTIASAPEEKELRIGIRLAPTQAESSSYKKALMAMPENGQVTAAALSGDFTLPKDPTKKLAFIAGGIGITPFRSMIQSLILKKEKRDIVVLYSSRMPEHTAYKDVLSEAEQKLGIKTFYVVTAQSKGVINADFIRQNVPDFAERYFYISGPDVLVTAMKRALRSLHLKATHIKTDYFPGF